jgi:hypothetical protein
LKTFIFISLILFGANSYSKDQCSEFFNSEIRPIREAKFENGHNVPLQNVMLKMRDYDFAIREFVDGLIKKNESKYLEDDSSKFRNLDALKEVVVIAEKYQKILSHLVEHSDHAMMSPRIQMIPIEKREEFVQKYKQAYVSYLETFDRLVEELKSLNDQEPSVWDPQQLQSLLMQLSSQMAAAHNRF